MYTNVHYVDLSETIFVQSSLWEKTTNLKTVLDFVAKDCSLDKIFVNNEQISEKDLGRELSTFGQNGTVLGGYELKIEKYK